MQHAACNVQHGAATVWPFLLARDLQQRLVLLVELPQGDL
jgi:hypothetical protein